MAKIFVVDGVLSFDGEQLELATLQEYELADRCVGSIFEALNAGETIELADGMFQLDDELDVIR